MATRSSKTVVHAAIAGNLAIALTKFVATAFTGSSAMLAEGVHSLVDTEGIGYRPPGSGDPNSAFGGASNILGVSVHCCAHAQRCWDGRSARRVAPITV